MSERPTPDQLEQWRAWLRTLSPDQADDSPIGSVYATWREQIDVASSGGSSPSRFRAVEAAAEFMMLGEQLLRALNGIPPSLGASSKPAPDPLRQAIADTGMGADSRGAEADIWAEMLSALPTEMLAALDRMKASVRRQPVTGMPVAAGSALANELFKALGNGTGPGANSWEADARRLLSDWNEFQSARERYGTLLARSAEHALLQMGERVGGTPPDVRPVESARAAYDLWIACSEESYAALLASDEFTDAHAAAINALAGLKSGCSRLGNHVAAWLDTPSRTEHTTLERRLQDSRRSQRQQHCRLELALRRYAALESRVEALERSIPARTAPDSGDPE